MGQISRLAKSILITGHRGFVGKNLYQYLLKRGYVVNGIDLKENEDLRDLALARRLFKRYRPDLVIHLAAITQVEDGLEGPKHCIENNVGVTVNVCELARELGFKLIHMSTDKVYGEGNNKKEGSPLRAVYPYDVSKLCCEKIVSSYRETFGIKTLIVRPCNIYGDNDPNYKRIIPSIIEALEDKKMVDIRSNGLLKRDYIYIGDFMTALEMLFKKEGIYNISSGENLSVLAILEIGASILPGKLQYVILNRVDREIISQSLNFNKLKRLGFKPEYSMSKFLGELLCKYQ